MKMITSFRLRRRKKRKFSFSRGQSRLSSLSEELMQTTFRMKCLI
jgi:hypothetical protein